MLSMVLVVVVMVFGAMMWGWRWVMWAAPRGRTRAGGMFTAGMNHLDVHCLVGHFDKRPSKRLPKSVRDLDTLLADGAEPSTATARARHHCAFDHRLVPWPLHELGDSWRLLDSMTKTKSFGGFLDGTRHNDQSNGLGGDLGDSRSKYDRKDT
jgi:hypothetical protein